MRKTASFYFALCALLFVLPAFAEVIASAVADTKRVNITVTSEACRKAVNTLSAEVFVELGGTGSFERTEIIPAGQKKGYVFAVDGHDPKSVAAIFREISC